MKKKLITCVLTLLAAACCTVTAAAGQWIEDDAGWRYLDDDGTYLTECWRWIDGNEDGTAECYYFNKYGYILKNVMTPDGYAVNSDGAWTATGKVQTMDVSETVMQIISDGAASEEAGTDTVQSDEKADQAASAASSSSWGASSGTDVQEFMDGMYVLDAMHTKAYLLIGEDKALLIDTLLESDNVREEAEKLTDLPIEVLITHGHPDHIGGISYFDSCYIHEADAYLLPEGIEAHYIAGGDVVTCGDFNLEVIEIPGHTFGSVALLDRSHRFLITGDSVQEGPIIMYGEGVDMEAYASSMQKLMAYTEDIDYIFAGHNRKPVGIEYIQYAYEDALALINGELEGTPRFLAGNDGHVYQGEHVSFFAE